MNTRNIFIFITLIVVVACFGLILFNKPVQDERKGSNPAPAVPTRELKSTPTPVIPRNQPPQTVNASPTPLPPPVPEETKIPRQTTDLDEIRRAIFGEDKDKRREALATLGSLLEKNQGKQILMEILEMDDPELLQDALGLLPKLGEEERISVILKGLDNDKADFRRQCLSLVRDISSGDMNDVLIKAMGDDSEEVQGEVAELFIYFTDRAVYTAAAEGLKHANEEIRDNALDYLRSRHTEKSVETLIQALESSNPDVVRGAGDALRAITGLKIKDNLVEDWRGWWESGGQKWVQEEAVSEDQ